MSVHYTWRSQFCFLMCPSFFPPRVYLAGIILDAVRHQRPLPLPSLAKVCMPCSQACNYPCAALESVLSLAELACFDELSRLWLQKRVLNACYSVKLWPISASCLRQHVTWAELSPNFICPLSWENMRSWWWVFGFFTLAAPAAALLRYPDLFLGLLPVILGITNLR